MTTLEEVFLKVNSEVEAKDENHVGASEKMITGEREQDPKLQTLGIYSENLVGRGTFGSSVKALLTKRFNIYKRDKCGLICEIIIPILLALIGLSILKVPIVTDSPAYYLDTSAFPGPQRVLFN
jgi:ATP-binding cassette subfamily A (ABC1) protein 3